MDMLDNAITNKISRMRLSINIYWSILWSTSLFIMSSSRLSSMSSRLCKVLKFKSTNWIINIKLTQKNLTLKGKLWCGWIMCLPRWLCWAKVIHLVYIYFFNFYILNFNLNLKLKKMRSTKLFWHWFE